MSEVVFLETTGDRHLQLIGGVSVIERRVREAAKAGAKRVIVAAAPFVPPRPWVVPVEFVAPGGKSTVPEGAKLERADVLVGIELVDEAARKQAEWKLIRGMNKSFEGPVDALINWRFSMRITRFLSHFSLAVTPNQITICAILTGLFAAFLASRGDYLHYAIAGVLLEFNSILDSCDGELARLRFQYSKLGQWLDNLSDDIVDNVFIVAIGYGLGTNTIWFPLAIAAAGGRVLVSITTYIDVYRRTGTGDVFAFRWWFETDKATADEVYNYANPVTWLRSFGRRDTFVFVWMLACVAHAPWWVVGHGLAIAAVNVSLLVLQMTVFRRSRVP